MQENQTIADQSVSFVRLSRIVVGINPRTYFDEKEMNELIASVAVDGIIQPILLRPLDDGSDKLQIVAGERRFRAALKVAETKEEGDTYQVPALIRRISPEAAAQMALIENIQRANMSPTEEAEASAKILGQCNGDRDETARLLGWPLVKLEKRLALMNCSASVREALTKRQILLGHAELLATAPKEKQDGVLKKILENPVLIPVSQFKATLEQASKELASAVFQKDACAGCKHSSANQQEMFAEAIIGGRCTNGACYDKKTQEFLDELKIKLAEEYPVIRIINVGENKTLTVLKSEGVDGVGIEQAALCKSCANYGAAISNIPGKIGTVYRNICFDVACNTQKVAASIKASKTAAAPKPATTEKLAGNSPSAATASDKTATKKVKSAPATVQDSQRVIDYRITVWRLALRKELMVDATKNLSALIGILMAVGGSSVSSTKLAAAFAKLTGQEGGFSSDVGKAALAVASASEEVRQKMLSGVAVSIMEGIDKHHLVGILEFLQVDLKKYWKLNEEYLNLLTKSEIEVVADELGLKAALGDNFSKAASGKKDEFVKSLLNIDGFVYIGKVPRVLQYQQ